jgi:hypothetical protein
MQSLPRGDIWPRTHATAQLFASTGVGDHSGVDRGMLVPLGRGASRVERVKLWMGAELRITCCCTAARVSWEAGQPLVLITHSLCHTSKRTRRHIDECIDGTRIVK